ncbi:hypothetical protein PENTCL1PPCAC_21421, partial [Pristionchus entomophagus]
VTKHNMSMGHSSSDKEYSLGSVGSLLDPLGEFGISIDLLLEISHLLESIKESGHIMVHYAHVINDDEVDPCERITHHMTVRAVLLQIFGENTVEFVSCRLAHILF